MDPAEPEDDNQAFEMRAVDLAERRRAALDKIDNAKFSRYHVKVCLVAGTGFFTDAYDIFAISVASVMLGNVYGTSLDPNNITTLSSRQDLILKVANPVGTLCGQLLFGWLADVVGRKRMYGLELMIIIVATFGQALSGQARAVGIIGALFVWRFLQGLGIGGDYPMSAVISSEFAATSFRGRLMTATFATQGFGTFTAALVAIIVVSAYKDSILDDEAQVDYCWRLLIGLGCVPAVIALLFRLTISETPRFTMDVERNIRRAAEDIEEIVRAKELVVDDEPVNRRVDVPKASWADFKAHFGQWKNMKVLIGTSWSWFAQDIAFYGLGLNTSIFIQAIGFGNLTSSGTQRVYDNLMNVSKGNLTFALAGLVPGYWVSFIFIDKWGRKPIQLMGFIMLTILFVIMGFAYDKLTAKPAATKAFVFLYCLTNFFQNFGPNTTTFVIPGEVFPTRYRSTAHGISAAAGKLGAIVSQFGFNKMHGQGKSLNHILEIFALFMLTGILSTSLIPETKNKSLEELSNEDQDGVVRN